jgi:hypothetical protein
VVFDEAAPLSPLPDAEVFDESSVDDIFGDSNYTPTDDEDAAAYDVDSTLSTPVCRPKRGIVASVSETDNP